MPTATRPDYLPLVVHAAEGYSTTVIDLQKPENQFFKMAADLGILEESRLGYAETRPIITTNNLTGTPITRGSTPPTTLPELFGATRIEYANIVAPVAFDAVQLEDAGGNDEVISLADSTIYLAAQASMTTLETDSIKGNAAESTRMLGLEQWVYPKDHLTPSGMTEAAVMAALLAYPRWKFRQANNTIAGITRTPFTGPRSGGTHFENLSVNGSNTHASGGGTALSRFGFSSTSANQLNYTAQFLGHFYNSCRQGTSFPDVIISTQRPYEDADVMGAPFLSINRDDGGDRTVNWGFGGSRYRGADWYWTESVAGSGVNGEVDAAGNDMIYFLNTNTWRILYSDRWFFSLVKPWVYSVSPMGVATQMWTKLQQVLHNPGLCGVWHNYGAA
jgi:hypothetical protein